MLIKPSTLESNKHGIKIGLVTYEDLAAGAALVTEAYATGYDIIKAQCNSREIDMFNRVEQLGMPYATAQTIVQSKLDIANYSPAPLSHDIDFELEQLTDPELAYSLSYNIMKDMGKYYFDNPINNTLFTKKAAIELHAEFIKDFVVNPTPNRQAFFYQHNGEYIGFIAVLMDGNVGRAYLGGVVDEYRQHGCGSQSYKKVIEQVFIPNGIKTAYMETQMQNMPSMVTAMLKGHAFYPSQSFVRLHLFPLAGYIGAKATAIDALADYTKLTRSKHITGIPGTIYNVINVDGYTLQAQQILNNGVAAGYHYFEHYG